MFTFGSKLKLNHYYDYEQAQDIWWNVITSNAGTCPHPCTKMAVFFGYPFIGSTNRCSNRYEGSVTIYFRNQVKITSEYPSYSFLRYSSQYKIRLGRANMPHKDDQLYQPYFCILNIKIISKNSRDTRANPHSLGP